MKALIMAGGKGTRLHPYSATLPKPLMPIGDQPLLEILLRKLQGAQINDIVLAVGHLRHLIEAFFGDGRRFGLSLTYSFEDRPLGTAGPIGANINQLGDTFLVTNGDLLTTLDLERMIDAHQQSGADATIGAYRRELKSDFGILDVDSEMRMIGYNEKPVQSFLVSMGVYVLNAQAVEPFVRPDTALDMPDLLLAMAAAGKTLRCYSEDCLWLDIGRPDDFAAAQTLFDENPDLFR